MRSFAKDEYGWKASVISKIKSVRHKVGMIVAKNQCLTSSNKSHEKLIIVEPSS